MLDRSATHARYLAVDAGVFRVALPLASVRQILDVGNGDASLDPRALGVMPFPLAGLLGTPSTSARPAVLLLESPSAQGGMAEPVVLTCCRLRGVVDAAPPMPLPRTVACQWPGLLRGTVVVDGADGPDMLLVLDEGVLMGLVESYEPSEPEVRG